MNVPACCFEGHAVGLSEGRPDDLQDGQSCQPRWQPHICWGGVGRGPGGVPDQLSFKRIFGTNPEEEELSSDTDSFPEPDTAPKTPPDDGDGAP